MKYLNVAEKNSAAKNIAHLLSRGTSTWREGLSKFNKIYEFQAWVKEQRCQMVMTSVSGHLMGFNFDGESYKKWLSCQPEALFDAPVSKSYLGNTEKIKETLEREIKGCHGLIIWTDCDREGENIGFEIIKVCTAVKSNLRIFRANFSAFTTESVNQALTNLEQPNKNISNAVDVRQELDLRIGAVFTRFQTLRLQRAFPKQLATSVVSYGSCQFPTLGFVVERYQAVESFVSEPFWKIIVNHTMDNLSIDFTWDGIKLDLDACRVLHGRCSENPQAKVCEVKIEPQTKWRPFPLTTVELEKLASTHLNINAKETMEFAQKLYTEGCIVYPRTDTNQFDKNLDLNKYVSYQTTDPNWGNFARTILNTGGPTPRQGDKNDGAHPPIYPTKYRNDLKGNEKRLYDFIVRSFLACCSKDAHGQETTVSIEVAKEKFTANGLKVTETNYLDVYPYDKWSSVIIHDYQNEQTFNPTSIEMLQDKTSGPTLLTEADLITLMENHGIGTDATHADHIEHIKQKKYVTLRDDMYFEPSPLGMGLIKGYDAMGLDISKPHLRAQLEADLRAISEGSRQPRQVLAEQVAQYKTVFETVTMNAKKLDEALLAEKLNEQPSDFYSGDSNAGADDNNVLCKCSRPAIMLIVKREGVNRGKKFYTCATRQCKFFLFAPESAENKVQNPLDTPSTSSWSNSDSNANSRNSTY